MKKSLISCSISWFLARRLLLNNQFSYAIKVVSRVCFAAIVIGSFALSLILAIMQGFQTATSERLQSIHPPLLILADANTALNFTKINDYLSQLPQIAACTPYATTYGVIHNPKLDQSPDLQKISVIKAIAPQTEILVSRLASKINCPNRLVQADLTTLLSGKQIIIGCQLAQNLQLKIGDLVEIFIPQTINSQNQSLHFKKVPATLSATIQTGLADFDDSLVLVALPLAMKKFPDLSISEIGLKLKNPDQSEHILNQLKTTLKLSVIAWQELYEPLMAALKLEKYTGVAIAFLIILMACMSLLALIFMLITKHTNHIAILKILGMVDQQIRQVFLMMSLLITSLACTSGLFLAFITGLFLQKYQFIDLPQAYLITNLPITLNWQIFSFVFLSTMSIALIATLVPLHLIKRLNLAQLLKHHN